MKVSKLQRALFLQCAILLSRSKLAVGFVPNYDRLSRPVAQLLNHREQRWGVPTKLRDVEDPTTSIDVNVLDGIKPGQEQAKNALTKLLEKQRSEIRETERLLQQFEEENYLPSFHFTNDTDIKRGGPAKVDDIINSSTSSAVAKSILSGIDYGFVSRSEGCTTSSLTGSDIDGYNGPPRNIMSLGIQQFKRNLNAIRGEYSDEQDNSSLTPKQLALQESLKTLTLNTTAIWEREKADDSVERPLLIEIPYTVLCYMMDVLFEGRYVFSRFFLLETVARMPYFSYISMLHLYETIGFWRRSSDVKRIHFAEEWNEFHHLLIMESLGGDQKWWIRFLSQHSALAYYTILVLLWSVSPTLAYKFSEMLETHAVHTYSQFLDENEETLRNLPPSHAAVNYYAFGASDPFFAEYQTSRSSQDEEIRRPGENMKTLHDVFSAIRDDEGDHVSTMKQCLDPDTVVRSPALEKKFATGAALVAAFGYLLSTGDVLDIDPESIGSALGDVDIDAAVSEMTDQLRSVGEQFEGDISGLGEVDGIFDVLEAVMTAIAALGSQFSGEENEARDGLMASVMEGEKIKEMLALTKSFLIDLIERIL